MIFDTGSANFWINSKKCKDEGCLAHKQYDSSISKNYKKIGFKLDVQFGTGQLSGVINEDSVFMGGIEVANQDFAEITNELGSVFVTVYKIIHNKDFKSIFSRNSMVLWGWLFHKWPLII